jgi:ABC-2 type transport system permease protein
MNKFFLYLVSLLNPLWRRLGVDVEQLRAILEVKLKMDDRRPSAYTQARQQKKKEIKNGSWGVIIMSFVMGIFYLYAFFIAKDHFLQMLIWFSLFMMMMSTTLIADFTSVLIDVKDNFVILPKPVNDKTVVVSRMMHIVIHISKIVVPMMLPVLVYLFIELGIISALWFVVLAFLLCIFSIFLINAVYLLALQLTTPEKFKEILNWIQMGLSVLLFGIVYLAPRVMKDVNLAEVKLADHTWLNLVPLTWFAGAWQAVTDGIYTPQFLIFIALSFIVPFVSLWLVIKIFAPSFNRKLAMLGGSGSDSDKPEKAPAVPVGTPWYKRLARLFTSSSQERLSFELVWLVTGRSREFKLKVYPSLAYVVIYFIYFFFTGEHSTAGEKWKHLPETKMFIFLIYSSSFAFITAISNLVYSDKYKSAWVYFAAPIESPGLLLMGAFKASLVKFFVPFYLLLSAFSLWVWGLKIMPDLVLGFFNVIVINLAFAFIYLRKLPFSAELNIKQSAGTFIKGMLILLVPGAIGVGHYFIAGYIWLVLIFGLMSFAALYLLYTKYRETGWEKLEAS